MSAKFSVHDTHWLLSMARSKELSPMDEAALFLAFDGETDHDENSIRKEMEEIRVYKRCSLIKLFIYIPETMVSWLFLNKQQFKVRNIINLTCIKFLFNKINYKPFKKDLIQATKNVII